ncbi:hypothetical protein BT63DRAFT_443157 [Microthyrium microscopicum]|uniref:Uncharacterized protein n=1 Tax=Microthyrium microscopicum TaxID=703497 RepID=A0A6A6U0J9_9PEZI|nr:hypothetical protein BT63DRAFT_443157 [Microthyrium microscopicum]
MQSSHSSGETLNGFIDVEWLLVPGGQWEVNYRDEKIAIETLSVWTSHYNPLYRRDALERDQMSMRKRDIFWTYPAQVCMTRAGGGARTTTSNIYNDMSSYATTHLDTIANCKPFQAERMLKKEAASQVHNARQTAASEQFDTVKKLQEDKATFYNDLRKSGEELKTARDEATGMLEKMRENRDLIQTQLEEA